MLVNKENLTTIWLENDGSVIKIIDQRFLPHELKIVTLSSLEDAEFAIREMQVRGAPLIGVTAAFEDQVIEVQPFKDVKKQSLVVESDWSSASYFYSIVALSTDLDLNKRRDFILNLAKKIREDDIEACSKIGEYGLEFY